MNAVLIIKISTKNQNVSLRTISKTQGWVVLDREKVGCEAGLRVRNYLKAGKQNGALHPVHPDSQMSIPSLGRKIGVYFFEQNEAMKVEALGTVVW